VARTRAVAHQWTKRGEADLRGAAWITQSCPWTNVGIADGRGAGGRNAIRGRTGIARTAWRAVDRPVARPVDERGIWILAWRRTKDRQTVSLILINAVAPVDET
jgi:hypothetical protein